jgi:1,4-dihydroxy-2-naphthoate octaprenyltransferase
MCEAYAHRLFFTLGTVGFVAGIIYAITAGPSTPVAAVIVLLVVGFFAYGYCCCIQPQLRQANQAQANRVQVQNQGIRAPTNQFVPIAVHHIIIVNPNHDIMLAQQYAQQSQSQGQSQSQPQGQCLT